MKAETLGTSALTLILIFAVPPCKSEPFSLWPSFPFPNVTLGSSRSGSVASTALESFRQLGTLNTEAFISRRLFNTSCAFTIPLFTFTLPNQGPPGSGVFLSNQLIFGLFGVLVTLMDVYVPVILTGIRSPTLTGRGFRDKSEDTQLVLDRLMENRPTIDLMGADTKHRIGLDTTKCLQKTICEAHRAQQNKEYGILALPFQIFFPPPKNGTAETRTPILQMAASVGKYMDKPCGDYFKCFFDILDLAAYLRDLYFWKSEENEINYNEIEM